MATPTPGLHASPDPNMPGDFDLFDAAGNWYGYAVSLSCDAATAEANARLWAGSKALYDAAVALLANWEAKSVCEDRLRLGLDLDMWDAYYDRLDDLRTAVAAATEGRHE